MMSYQLRWILVIGFLINFVLGSVLVWSVFRPPLHEPPYNISTSFSTLPYSISVLFFGLTMMLASKLLTRIGLIRLSFIGIGSVLIRLGYILCSTISFSPHLAILMISMGFGIVVDSERVSYILFR